MFGLKPYIYLTLFSFSLFGSQVFAGQLTPSTVVQANITLLAETKSCPQCDLSGADLNRLDLSGANLEGANLSRAKMSLTNLSGANLHNADLREAILNGADLANIDLRGADLTGASLVGAYMIGALMDGEMVATTVYDHEGISDIEKTVYVEDTVNPKVPQETEEMTIGSRRDFEETPPAVPGYKVQIETGKSTQSMVPVENATLAYAKESLPKQSTAAPAAKAAPAIQEVRIEEEVTESEMLLTNERKKHLSTEGVPEQVVQQDVETVDKSVKDAFAENDQTQIVNDDQQEELQQEIVKSEEMPTVTGVDVGRQLTQQDTLHPVADSVPAEASNVDQGKPEKGVGNVDIPETGDDSLAAETAVANPGVVDHQAVGIVQSMFNVFSSDEPSTEVMKNVAILLDVNQCYGCNLAGVNLSGENLDNADLEGADLSYAILRGVDLEGANLKGANLTGADLSGADLSEADMYKAILTDADLTDADLEGTLLDDVNLSGVKGYKKQAIMLMKQN